MIESLLAELRERIGRPLEESVSMPRDVYVREDFHEVEKATIFSQGWHCVGRADEVAKAGQYIAMGIADEPVFVLRGQDGVLRAFSNICKHRFAALVSGSGTIGQRLVCPYHAWSYDHSGHLVTVTNMPAGFDKSGCRLDEHHVCTWGGWVYVSLASAPPSLAEVLAPLTALIGDYEPEKYELLFTAEAVWETNWKCLIENFAEAYHVPIVHSRTIQPVTPHYLIRYEAGGEGFFRYVQVRASDTAGSIFEGSEACSARLSETMKTEIPIIGVLPTQLISISPQRTFWLCVQPDGVARTRIRWGVSVYPDKLSPEEREAYAARSLASHEEINGEDRAIIESIYRNARSLHATGGRLSVMERSLWEFQQYVARTVTASPAA